MQWIVCIAAAIVQASGEGSGQNMTELAQTAGMSRQTLYHHLRLAIECLHWVYLNKPIAGVLFVIEELLQDVSGITLGTAILASFIASIVARISGSQLVAGFV